MKAGYIDYEIPFFVEWAKETVPSDAHSYIARRSISKPRGTRRYVPFMPIRARGIKKKGEKKRGKKGKRKWQREKRDSERFSPRSPAGCWFSQSVFSSLLVVHRFSASSPRILSRLSSFFSQIDLASGDLFQVTHTRFSPPPVPSPRRRPRRPRAGWGVNLLCISLHRTVARPFTPRQISFSTQLFH